MSLASNIPVITVGICTQPRLRFAFPGRFTASNIPSMLGGEWTARRSGDLIVVEQNGTVIATAPEFLFTPVGADDAFTMRDVAIGIQFHWQRKEDQQFLGSLKLVPSGDEIAAVNVVGIEDYLASVISSEMSARAASAFLRAHAITSRSWLVAQLAESKSAKREGAHSSLIETETSRIRWYDRKDHELFDVCADDHCQRYHGIAGAARVKDALDATRGIVLTYEGQVCDARFSKCCGGVTERFENVWEPVVHPYLTSVVDAPSVPAHLPVSLEHDRDAEAWIRRSPPVFCNTDDQDVIEHVLPSLDRETKDFFRWKVEYSQHEIASLISEKSRIDFGGIMDLVPRRRGSSGRIIELTIVGEKKTLTVGKELEIRRMLSPSHLYSSAFFVEKSEGKSRVPSRFVLHGAGWGHGVGLCQIGAAVMGEQGYDHERILSHYFPHTQLTALY